jgi:hypothetical protein
VIVVAIGSREEIWAVFKITIVPPGKGIGPEFLKQAEDRKKGGYADNQIEQLTDLGPCTG